MGKRKQPGVTAIFNWRTAFRPSTIANPLDATRIIAEPTIWHQYYNFRNMGPNSQVTGGTGRQIDNRDQFLRYAANYKYYQYGTVTGKFYQIFPGYKYSPSKIPALVTPIPELGDVLGPQQLGSYWIKADPSANTWINCTSWANYRLETGIRQFNLEKSSPLTMRVVPRYPTIVPRAEWIVGSSPAAQGVRDLLKFQIGKYIRKPRPTFSEQFISDYSSTVIEPDATYWEGFTIGYEPPVDVNGQEYGKGGYNPQIFTNNGLTMGCDIKLKIRFTGYRKINRNATWAPWKNSEAIIRDPIIP